MRPFIPRPKVAAEPLSPFKAMLAGAVKKAKRGGEVLDQAAEAWRAHATERVFQATEFRHVTERGVLVITVKDAAIAYEADRLLRCGVLAKIQEATHRRVAAVKVRQF